MVIQVDREVYMTVIKDESTSKATETVNRSVMESFDEQGRLIASAEYVGLGGGPVQVIYRVNTKRYEPFRHPRLWSVVRVQEKSPPVMRFSAEAAALDAKRRLSGAWVVLPPA